MRHILLIPIALCCVVFCAGCNGLTQRHAEIAAADSLCLDSADFFAGNDSVEVKLHMEYFTGQSPLSRGIRNYVCERLEGLWDYVAYAGTLETEEIRKWEGGKDDISGMTAFYGRQMYENMLVENQELYADSESDARLWMCDISLRVLCSTEKYVTFRCEAYTFTGGAHGYLNTRTSTFVRKSGKALTQVVDTTKTLELQPLILQGLCHRFNYGNYGEDHIDRKDSDETEKVRRLL